MHIKRRRTSFVPSPGRAADLRGLAAHGDDALRNMFRRFSTEFMTKHELTGHFPRHDVMDHTLPFEEPLTISQADEVFADLVKRCTLDFVLGAQVDRLPADFLMLTIHARAELDGYDYEPDVAYLLEAGTVVWEATQRFYGEVGREATRRTWDVGCRLHYELNGRLYRDDYFAGAPFVFGDPENIDKCG
jgi:hypothetical protein